MTSFPAKEHAQKTIAALMNILDQDLKTKPHIIFLQGALVEFRNDTDREILFRQESNFYYLTGCDVPGSSFITVLSGSGDIDSTLLIPKEDPLETMWSPPPPSLEQTSDMHPSISIKYTDQLVEVLDSYLAKLEKSSDVVLHTLPSEHPSPFPPLPPVFKKMSSKSNSKYLLPALHEARLIKTPFEIELIRKANAISSRAHEVIMRLLGKHANDGLAGAAIDGKLVMPDEWRIEREAEAEAAFVASCRREGALHQAYMPIVAGAERASTLHYCCNDRDLAWGPLENGNSHHPGVQPDLAHEHDDNGTRLAPQVLLLDAGCEWKNYASDITRTTPVGNGGRFTAEAREIYSLVLKMQNDAIAALRPGMHWDELQYQCHVTLVKRFIELGIFVGSENDVLDSQISAAFYPHGLGHSLGMDVHDVPSASKPELGNKTIPALSRRHPEFYKYLRLRIPLQAGMVLTVEPGCYFSPHLLAPHRNSKFIDHIVLKRYERVGGVRIEDVLAINHDGAENLTTVGKEVDWIEAVSSGRV